MWTNLWITCYNPSMYKHQDDIDLLEKLDQKRSQLCHFCGGISKYHQPDNSGHIVNVCEEHFTYKYFA